MLKQLVKYCFIYLIVIVIYILDTYILMHKWNKGKETSRQHTFEDRIVILSRNQ